MLFLMFVDVTNTFIKFRKQISIVEYCFRRAGKNHRLVANHPGKIINVLVKVDVEPGKVADYPGNV